MRRQFPLLGSRRAVAGLMVTALAMAGGAAQAQNQTSPSQPV